MQVGTQVLLEGRGIWGLFILGRKVLPKQALAFVVAVWVDVVG
jgi:hypothetical protein